MLKFLFIPALIFCFTVSAQAKTCNITDVNQADALAYAVSNTRSQTIANEKIAEIVVIQQRCAGEPNVELAVAYALEKRLNIPGTPPEQQLGFANNAWIMLDRLDQFAEQNRRARANMVRINTRIALAQDLVRLANDHSLALPVFTDKADLPRCAYAAENMIQNLFYDYKKQMTANAPFIASKIASGCKNENSRYDRQAYEWNAKLFLHAAETYEDAKNKAVATDAAIDSLETWVGSDSLKSVNASDNTLITDVLTLKAIRDLEAGTNPAKVLRELGPVDLDAIYAKILVGYAADAKWDVDASRVGTTEASKAAFKAQFFGFQDFVKALDVAARENMANTSVARTALFEGIEGHADKIYRSKDKMDAITPIDILRAPDPSKD